MTLRKSTSYVWFLSVCFLVLVLTFLGKANGQRIATAAQVSEDKNEFSGLSLSLVSQRRRKEPRRGRIEGDAKNRDYQEIIRDDLLIRFRLANNGERRIYFLARLNTIEPAVYQLFRNAGEQNWKSSSPARGRSGSFTGGGYQWLLLPPGTAVEFETLDLSTRGEQHSISIFISLEPSHETRTEFFSDMYKPLNVN